MRSRNGARGALHAPRAARRLRGQRAEVAVFDIVLFVPLLLVGLLFLNSIVTLPTSTVAENVNSSRYAAEGMATTLQATVPHARTYLWEPPWWGCPFGCWVRANVEDWTVYDLVLWDVYLVSCGVSTQAQLDNRPWMGYYIALTAAEVAQGALAPTPPTTYANYYFEFNGTANGFAGPGCYGPVTPVRDYDSNLASYPASPSTQLYTWSTVLQPDQPGEGPVMVQLGLWGP